MRGLMVRVGEEFAGYRIERKLGGGGMGVVYLARHPRLPRLVAIKVLARELASDNQTRARFEREAELVARLDHPNIVTVHDRGVADGRLWIAMQYVDGGDAAALDAAALTPRDAVRVITETAKALDYAHSMGVIHRDVKPANILLTRATPDWEQRILLTDFGIGRLRDDSAQLTRTGMLAATITYASPEQLSGGPLDERSDQYSLACTFFRLLTGATPFQAETAAAVIAGHLHHPPPLVTDRRPELPAALDEVIVRGLAKRPEQRYESCREFADAAAQALSMFSDSAAPPIIFGDAALAAFGRASADTVLTTDTDTADHATTVLPVLHDLPPITPDEPPAAPARRGRRVAAGVGGLVAALAAGAGILWGAQDSEATGEQDPPPASIRTPAPVYPGFVPLTRIDAQGRPVAAPVSVQDPANDGRLPCEPVSIAAALPLSGENAALGRTILGSVRLAVAELVRGGNNTCAVTVREFDTAGQQRTAAQVAASIAQDESIVAVIGPALSGEVIATGRIFEAAGLAFLTPSASNPVLAQSGWTGFFRGLANDNAQGPAVGRYLAGTAGYSRVCVVRDSGGGFGDELADMVTEGLGAAATCEVGLTEKAEDRAVTAIAAARPDAVYYSGHATVAADLLTRLRRAGVTVPFIVGDGGYDPTLRTSGGTPATGTLVACQCGPATERFRTDYRAATGTDPAAHTVEAYDLTAIVLRGIVSGHTARTDLRRFLHDYTGDGIAQTYGWSAAGELTEPRIWLYRID
ncbi:bifunctional serine/threonine-protein kinase/ABC transporter substrate-binding protein [Nocardia sp. NPDC003693]